MQKLKQNVHQDLSSRQISNFHQQKRRQDKIALVTIPGEDVVVLVVVIVDVEAFGDWLAVLLFERMGLLWR